MGENSLTFYRGAATDGRYFYAIGYFDDLEVDDEPFPRLRLVRFDRHQDAWDVLSTQEWNAAGIVVWTDATGRVWIAVAGTKGEILQGPQQDLQGSIIKPDLTQPINGIGRAQDGLAVAGFGSSVLVRPDAGAWSTVVEGMTFETLHERVMAVGSVDTYPSVEAYMVELNRAMEGFETFYAVQGFYLSALLISGDKGRLVYWDGSLAHVLDSGTKVNLAQMVQVSDGWIVVGSAPTTVVLHVDRETRTVTQVFADDVLRVITSVAHHDGKILLGGIAPLSHGIVELENGRLSPVDAGGGNVWAIASVAEGLWAMSEKRCRLPMGVAFNALRHRIYKVCPTFIG